MFSWDGIFGFWLLDGLLLNLVHTLMVPWWCTLWTLVILWLSFSSFHFSTETSHHLDLCRDSEIHGSQRLNPNVSTKVAFVILHEISQRLLDSLPWHLVHTFMIPTGWIIMTLMILQRESPLVLLISKSACSQYVSMSFKHSCRLFIFHPVIRASAHIETKTLLVCPSLPFFLVFILSSSLLHPSFLHLPYSTLHLHPAFSY